MLYLAAVVLVDRLHNELHQQRRFAAQLFHVYFERIIGTVHRLAVVQEVGHFDRQLHRFVGILDVEGVIGAVFRYHREVALAREVAQGRLDAQNVLRAVGFGGQQVCRPQIDVADGRGENNVRGLVEGHLQRVRRDHAVEGQRTGQPAEVVARRRCRGSRYVRRCGFGYLLRRSARYAS